MMVLCLCGTALSAQDIHYSQFYNAPMNLNPALTGIFQGDTRLMTNYRRQWNPVVDYMTVTGVADMKFYPQAPRPGFFSGGLTFHYDRAGISPLQLIHLGLSGSYTRQLSNHAFLTLGASMSGNQRGFKLNGFTFDQQFDPDLGVFDPGRGTGESFNSINRLFLDFGTGINFRLQSLSNRELVDEQLKRNKLDIGVGLFHLTRPDQSFYEGYKSPLMMRISPYLAGTLQLSKDVDFVGNFNVQIQGPYREWLAMGGLKLHLERTPGKQFALQPAIGYRFNEFGDAYYPALDVFYNSWRLGLSWDVNVSGFSTATNRNGGPELSLQYIISKPLLEFKICPLL